MLTINKIFPQEKIPEKTESFLFFDIETTGFSRDNTILYLIGCGYFAEAAGAAEKKRKGKGQLDRRCFP